MVVPSGMARIGNVVALVTDVAAREANGVTPRTQPIEEMAVTATAMATEVVLAKVSARSLLMPTMPAVLGRSVAEARSDYRIGIVTSRFLGS